MNRDRSVSLNEAEVEEAVAREKGILMLKVFAFMVLLSRCVFALPSEDAIRDLYVQQSKVRPEMVRVKKASDFPAAAVGSSISDYGTIVVKVYVEGQFFAPDEGVTRVLSAWKTMPAQKREQVALMAVKELLWAFQTLENVTVTTRQSRVYVTGQTSVNDRMRGLVVSRLIYEVGPEGHFRRLDSSP